MAATQTTETYDAMAERVGAMTEAECRARLAEFAEMGRRGDFSFSYDEKVLVESRLPAERAARGRAAAATAERARRRVTRR